MSAQDMKELSYSLKFKEMSEFGTVFSYDTIGDIFYIIIKGECQVSIPDPLSSEPAKKRLTTK